MKNTRKHLCKLNPAKLNRSVGACTMMSNFRRETTSGLTSHAYEITTYGIHQTNEWHASLIMPNSEGGVDYVLCHWGTAVAEISLQFPGVHNVLNSLALQAIITIMKMSSGRIPIHDILEFVKIYLNMFKGVSRRFEMMGKVNGCSIYDDYAHHPTEVRAVIQAARQKHPSQKLWVVFQPHTFSRLAILMKDFADAFTSADHVIITEVYAARGKNIWNVNGKDLADKIIGPPSEYIHRLVDAVDKLVAEISSGNNQEIIVLTLGAGKNLKSFELQCFILEYFLRTWFESSSGRLVKGDGV